MVSRSMRKVAKAQRRAERHSERASKLRHRSLGLFDAPSGESASEEERMSILRMLEKGKINVDEAEQLLKALEGES